MRNNTELLKSYYENHHYFNLYDKLGYFANTKEEIGFIIRNTSLKSGDRVLDLGCGHGRHSIGLALRGLEITAVDFSEFLLNLARIEAEESKVKIDFKLTDMRRIRFNDRFNLVICLFSSFGLFSKSDNLDLLFKISNALTPNGYFVLDVDNLFRLLQCLKTGGGLNKIHVDQLDLTEKLDFNQKTKVLRWRETYGQQFYRGYYQYYSKLELKKALRLTGFRIVNVFGSFKEEIYSKNSERLIFICQKIQG